MNNEEKILSILEDMQGRMGSMENRMESMENRMESMDNRMESMDNRMENMEERQERIEHTVIRIENDHGKQLQALHDGYIQHTQQLDRIEKRVSANEEFVLKRVF